MDGDLTVGNITGRLLKFAFPLMVGNVLQQFYNVADTLIVGRFLGTNALAAVGSSYTLMTFLTSILIGLSMGSSAYFAIQFGKKDYDSLNRGIFLSFVLIGVFTLILNVFVFVSLPWMIHVLQVPVEIHEMIKEYLLCIFLGLFAIFLYNFFANLLRGVGNSLTPLIFLGISAVLNIFLDILFVVFFSWGVRGAAAATVIAQYVSGIGIGIYYYFGFPMLRVKKCHMYWEGGILKEIFSLSFLTCLQQSVMNFGILMVQGLVNSFGTVIMAAFAAAVKIDTFAYMPVQDFGNAFSTFVAQNYGAGKKERIREGMRRALVFVFVFCGMISILVCLFARPLMGIFVDEKNQDVIMAGVGYLRIEAAFYFGIGLLFLLYGYYRAVKKPGMSVVLTLCSLGTRVALAYILSRIPAIGVTGIWAAIPIGWALADAVGVCYYFGRMRRK
ncbi:MAG: MATE family efflux transporter [Lachnospiraceae bacterium]|uniref:MATE family efflux transporter n=1 Tax=Roseburia sp. 1XD42-69 TaxID=2320088 RepID=UPI000EA1342F|nr:MATE family efflux transporter [Roseburia sp. 1XD42-69]MCI8876662.1 MATE family efflux transporter [Lachnospiraceae bacterium]RKJ62426.1 MATE family efflux transporter [Roseburia sp. 1XD42-69]